MQQSRGFTLIELSIVLVIIALVIASVLIGRDMILDASVRAQASQLNKMSLAVNVFREKFGGLPGDISPRKAQAFDMLARNGTATNGDENGRIECADTANFYFGCERSLFWSDLFSAGLTERPYTLGTSGPIEITEGQQELYVPRAKLDNSSFIGVGIRAGAENSCNSANFCFYINTLRYSDSDGATVFGGLGNGPFTPMQAYMIDAKMDDAVATTGIVRAGESWSGMWNPAMGQTTCANPNYVTDGSITAKNCGMAIQY